MKETLDDKVMQMEVELKRLRYLDERYRIAADNSSEIIIDYNLQDDSIYHATDGVTKIYGIPQKIENAPDYLVNCGAIFPESAEEFTGAFRRLHDGEPKVSCTLKTRTEAGKILWCEIILTNIFDENGVPVRAVGVLKDVTAFRLMEMRYENDINEEKNRAMKLKEKAERDLLTGLYNKITAEQLICKAIESDLQRKHMGALFIIDLDDFKNINDQLGHAFGDAVISETASRLQSMCREDDIAGRVGGDEFMLYLKSMSDAEGVEGKVQRICDMFRHNYTSGEKQCKVSGTVGVALLPRHGTSFEELYNKADLALYEAKRLGKDQGYIFVDGLKDTVKQTLPRAEIDQGPQKSFSKNIIEYVFRILYESRDLSLGIQGILELISQHFQFERSYIFELGEDGKCSLKYEWHRNSLNDIPLALKTMKPEEMMLSRMYFESKKEYILEEGAEPEGFRYSAFPPAQQLSFRLQYGLRDNGRFQGFVGFDRYTLEGSLTTQERTSLQGAAQMMEIFITDKRATARLVASGAMLQAVSDSLHSCTYIVDPKTFLLHFVNQNARETIPEAVPGALCYETIRDRSEPCEDCPIVKMMQTGKKENQMEMYLDRYQLWAKNHTTLIQLADEKVYGLCNCYDFAEYEKQDGHYTIDAEAFTDDTTLYNALMLSTDDYIYMCDMAKNLFYFPDNMVEEFGLPGQIVEDAIPLWASLIHEDEREAFLKDIDDMISGKSNRHAQEYRAKNKAGSWIWLRCRGYLERDKDGNPTLFAGVVTNMGKKNKIDYISGLQNKFEFENYVRTKLSDQPDRGTLLLLGLDNFKHTNDLYGWDFGDQIIREMAQEMQSLLPEKVQLYRLDGDMFGVFLCSSDGRIAKEYYAAVREMCKKSHAIDGKRYFCTVSAGGTVLQETPFSFSALFKQAEFALDYAKKEGKNKLYFYDEKLMGVKNRSLELLNSLQVCVNQEYLGFEVYFQPQVEPTTCAVKSAEALLRWNSPEFGSVSPVEFIPLLEHSGLINRVGHWVLIQAADVCQAWRKIQPDFTINVNLSFLQLQDRSFLPNLTGLVNSGRICPEGLHLEITESSMADGRLSLLAAFQSLRGLGFRIEMDDFGTGYSSLEMLKNAPADVVKIDRAFVMDITHSDFDATFIRFIVSLCHSVNIRVCLEGVETWEEYNLVKTMDLDLIQGFLFGKPQSCADFERNYFEEQKLS